MHVQKSCFGLDGNNLEYDQFCYNVPTFMTHKHMRKHLIDAHLKNYWTRHMFMMAHLFLFDIKILI